MESDTLEMGELEVSQFQTLLAKKKVVSTSAQNQVFSALLFLYLDVLKREFGWLENVGRAKNPTRLPVVSTPLLSQNCLPAYGWL
jgi:hypothetical protein